MKKILIILLVVIIVFAITGCSVKKSSDKLNDNIKIGKESNINITDKNITLKIKEGTLTNTGAVIVLDNNSDITISFGEDYWLEIEQNGKWYSLKTINDFVVNTPLYHLKPSESKEKSVDWGFAFGKFPRGKYRITKGITLEFENDKKEDNFVVGEFAIN